MSRHVPRLSSRRSSLLVPALLAALAGCQGDTTTAPRATPTVHFAQGANGVWTVNTLADPGDGTCDDTECTFREAVASASNGHSIVFTAGLQGEILLTAGAVSISSKSVAVDGGGRIAVNAQGLSRAIDVVSSTGPLPDVTIKRLTVKNGFENIGGGKPGRHRRSRGRTLRGQLDGPQQYHHRQHVGLVGRRHWGQSWWYVVRHRQRDLGQQRCEWRRH